MSDILKEWYKSNGDDTLRIDYPLNEYSIVWDVGGYKGEWAKKIYEKYNCTVILFEPIYYEGLKDKLPGIYINNFGLGGYTRTVNVDKKNDATSIFNEGSEKMVIKDVQDMSIYFVNLIKINIEGMEYELLNRLIELDLIQYFDNIQVQFHRFVPNADNLRLKITEVLKQTHIQTWCYDWVWENWKLK